MLWLCLLGLLFCGYEPVVTESDTAPSTWATCLRLLLLLLRLLRLPCAAEGVRWPLPLGGVVVMAGGGPLCAELDMLAARVRNKV